MRYKQPLLSLTRCQLRSSNELLLRLVCRNVTLGIVTKMYLAEFRLKYKAPLFSLARCQLRSNSEVFLKLVYSNVWCC